MPTERERAFWDGYWSGASPTIEARTMSGLLDRVKLGYLLPLLPPAGRTLEVGAGSGRLSCFLALRGHRTVCLDFAPAALRAARQNYAAVRTVGEFVTGDATRLPFSDGRFDVVLSTGLLEHFADPAPILGEMARVLRPGGLFYSDIVPRKFSLFRSLEWLGGLKRLLLRAPAPESFFERSFTGDQIRALLAQAGLAGGRVFAAGVVPPYLPLLSRSAKLQAAQVRLVERTLPLWSGLDGTRLAEWLGFYYFAWARKPGGGSPSPRQIEVRDART